jgi:hypothetical protein
MFKATIKPMQTVAPKTVPNPGSVSADGPSGAARKPRVSSITKSTRDYGKSAPSAMPMAGAQPSPSPYGPGRLGGI